MSPERFAGVISTEEYQALQRLVERARNLLHGRVIWNVNSTATGGGVAELLRPLLGYCRDGGVDARWVVIQGNPMFFAVTKRLHNLLHGTDGDGGKLTDKERGVYEETLAENASQLATFLRPDDIVILHDPQTAGLTAALHATGATIVWRCHVGIDSANDLAHRAWSFLLPYVVAADAQVFSRRAFVWDGLDPERIAIIPPSIDSSSPKNAEMTRDHVVSILAAAGISADRAPVAPTFTRSDGTPGRVDRRAEMIEDAPIRTEDPVVIQISRWDWLKDPIGVMRGFTEHVPGHHGAHLILVGPSCESVADDPEGADVLAAVTEAWSQLPMQERRRVHLAALPMDDIEENAAIVNALQRHARVVVQKSVAEGFGLTVAEAMWKSRPVVASRVGGIGDQIVDGESGFLIDDPHDLEGFGAAVGGLLERPQRALEIGKAAHARVREHFLGPRHLAQYFEFVRGLVGDRPLSELAEKHSPQRLAAPNVAHLLKRQASDATEADRPTAAAQAAR
ncbi:MAG TPA: glycosyltransferase [Solirubrobacteraceae bacterium]|nr:glycosyltransferase [Solirubrobacteraceae bacterium]